MLLASLIQKFQQELQGHQPQINKVVANGDVLVKQKHFATPDIRDKQKELEEAWDDLLQHSDERRKNLDLSLRRQRVGIPRALHQLKNN